MADTPHDPERDDESDGREAAAAADLASTILDEEAVRRSDEERRATTTESDDEQLPGGGADEIALRDGLARGGLFTFMVLLALNSLDELEGAAINVLGPDIGETFDVSDGTITFISAASVAFFVLGAGPLGYLADRLRRGPIVGVASLAFSGFVALSGLAVNAFMFFWTRFFAGISKSNTITVHATLLADAYPIGIRGRMFALNSAIGRVFAAASPVLVGGIAVLAGGDDGWRWAYLVMAVPVAARAVLAFAIPEPERGRWEKQDVLGHPVEPTATQPPDTEPPDTEPPDESPDDEAEPAMIAGEALPDCRLEAGIVGAIRVQADEIADLAGPVFVADMVAPQWIYNGTAPLPGGAPWNYGSLAGLDAADYVMVPLCAVSTRSRRAILDALAGADVTLEEVRRSPRVIVYRITRGTA